MGVFDDMYETQAHYAAPGGRVKGDIQYGAPVAFMCAVERRASTSRVSTDTERFNRTLIATNVEIPENSLIWLPGKTVGDQKESILVNGVDTQADCGERVWVYECS